MEDGADVHVKVYYLLRKMWARRTKYPEEVPLRPLKKGELKIEEWPDLIPVMVLDSDDDWPKLSNLSNFWEKNPVLILKYSKWVLFLICILIKIPLK